MSVSGHEFFKLFALSALGGFAVVQVFAHPYTKVRTERHFDKRTGERDGTRVYRCNPLLPFLRVSEYSGLDDEKAVARSSLEDAYRRTTNFWRWAYDVHPEPRTVPTYAEIVASATGKDSLD